MNGHVVRCPHARTAVGQVQHQLKSTQHFANIVQQTRNKNAVGPKMLLLRHHIRRAPNRQLIPTADQIGRASCRERVEMAEGDVELTKKKKKKSEGMKEERDGQ